jgi:enoyl-CoA hydratase
MARELVMTGAMIDAQEALRIGLVNKVLPADKLLDAARETAKVVASMGPLAVAEAKKVLREGEGRLLRDANALEIDGFAGCFETEDQKEGMQAFLERRSPSFGRA